MTSRNQALRIDTGPISVALFIKELGRGKDGARSLTRTQARELWGAMLDGKVSDLELGAVCIALRIKGETTDELLGFLDATHERLSTIESDAPWVVLPSYNGARKLPVLTPLLAGLLARRGVNVLVHGQAFDPARITSAQVWHSLGWAQLQSLDDLKNTPELIAVKAHECWTNRLFYCETDILNAGLNRLLNIRRVIGLRNSAHSVVKLMNPVAGARSLLVASYTHPEYRVSMAETLAHLPYRAMLLRATEGECVADPRRMPQMDIVAHGKQRTVQVAQAGALCHMPNLPTTDAGGTSAYVLSVLKGQLPVPQPIGAQVEHILLALENFVP